VSPQETEESIFRLLLRVGLLIIDDVGKFRPHDLSFLQRVYFRIMDERTGNELPVILVTNMDYTELEGHLGGATTDRLKGMCGQNGFIEMTGPSQR